MKNILLVGMPGCGKSTVGVVLAKTIGFDFCDTDLLICKREGCTLQKIIEEKGIEAFGEIENAVGCELELNDTVIATGGSMVLWEDAMLSLKKNSVVVFIDVELAELERRITNITTRGITFAKGETLGDLYRTRRPYYEKYADITVKIRQGSLENTVERLYKEIKNMI